MKRYSLIVKSPGEMGGSATEIIVRLIDPFSAVRPHPEAMDRCRACSGELPWNRIDVAGELWPRQADIRQELLANCAGRVNLAARSSAETGQGLSSGDTFD